MAKFRAAALLVAVMAAAPAMAQLLIVRASGPSSAAYAPGRVLDRKAQLSLKAGDEIVIMDGGGTRTLRGPANVVAGAAGGGASSGTIIARLSSRVDAREARTGAIRGGPGASMILPGLWAIDTTNGGTFCVMAGAEPQLWRAEASAEATLPVRRGDNGAPVNAIFSAGAHTAPWPAENRPTASGDYIIGPDETAQSVTVRVIPATANLADLAAAMAREGCDRQVALLRANAQ